MSQEQSVIDAFLIKGTEILFNNIVLYIYICVAILYTILMKGAQFRYVFHAGRLLFRKHKGGGTSGFASYAISTASRVGAGNMAGIMVAISTGGPGALFWMWIMALFGSAMSFGESTLAQFYKEKNSLGQYVGGGSFYIRSRLKMPLLAATFALIMITANTSVNGIQANTIANSLAAYNLDKNIALCFHSHNNLQLSFSNAQCLMKVCKDRELIIDSTVFGMGRGAGNLPAELLLAYLAKTLPQLSFVMRQTPQKYNPVFYFELIEKYFVNFQNNQTQRGYTVPHLIAGIKNIHPNYADELAGKNLSYKEIYQTSEIIKEKNLIRYDKNISEKIIGE